MGSTGFRDPQTLSSALAALGSLEPRALGSLNPVDPSVSVSNYYGEKLYRPLLGGLLLVRESLWDYNL